MATKSNNFPSISWIYLTGQGKFPVYEYVLFLLFNWFRSNDDSSLERQPVSAENLSQHLTPQIPGAWRKEKADFSVSSKVSPNFVKLAQDLKVVLMHDEGGSNPGGYCQPFQAPSPRVWRTSKIPPANIRPLGVLPVR